ncbi:hypothetical protein ASD56_06790 [Microbacterium sp. Root166]|uniref:DUF5684 domain-containing protein n=1 Tax=Microbacterium sp. Root166 TaxID=1736478 RepID=UPI0006FE227F|nr:DUF5684 domain-containing protein [Microbacterium sp. Root166]KQZ85973.1 hypothetical protein ASD56_06790 [Microbacterium sp. Root166]
MTAVDSSASVVPILLSLIAVAALYVWTALALSAVFRKSGEEGWKAWVPVLNVIVLLQLGSFSPWLVLVGLVPILGPLALWVLIVLACYRINLAFGFGVGMTVVAALSLPVWATVIGFGATRWVGAEAPAARRRSSEDSEASAAAYPAAPPLPSAAAPAWPGGSWAPEPANAAPPVPPLPTATAAAFSMPSPSAPSDEPISFVPAMPASAPRATPPVPPTPAAAPTPAAQTPAAQAAPAPAAAAGKDGWGGFDFGAAGEFTDEVTAAVAGAPGPVSAAAASGRPKPDPLSATPPVTRVPAAQPSTDDEPWSPSRSPLPDSDAFPEASGEVSAVAGAPDAGIPRSARASVSAQHVLPEIPDDDVEETMIASRRKAHWSLQLPTGTAVDLHADVVLVGRRPAPSTAFPNAQLVEVDDGTVSKTHLRLERHGDEWSVTDLHSTNGTILIASDGAEREIAPGAAHRAPRRFLIGDAELRLADETGR